MDKRIEQLGAMGRFGDHAELLESASEMFIVLVVLLDAFLPLFGFPVLSNLVENIDLIISSLDVMLSTLLNLECHVGIVLQILS